MKKIKILSIITFIILTFFSCKNGKDFLDTQPLDKFPESAVWQDPGLMRTYVNDMYRKSLGFPFAIEQLCDYVDEAHFTPGWQVDDWNKCLMTSDNLLAWESGNSPGTQSLRWDTLYKNIRSTNIFLSKVKESTVDDAVKKQLTGEVYFLRGLSYFILTNLYGGVPIITKVYGLGEDYAVARNTYEECVNFIAGQLDSAALNLGTSTDGRATKGAALAIKTRLLLYAASDLHQKMSDYAPGYAHPELLGYTSGNQATRWQAAKDAALAVINLGQYELYKSDPAPTDSVAQNFADYFIMKSYTKEDILLQFFSTKTDEGWQGYNPALYCGPNGYHNWGNNCPLQDLVDDYEMKDGSSFDWNNAAQKASPYTNREARFYATILYEGVPWRKRPDDGLKIDPLSRIQTGWVVDASDKLLAPGLDTREGPIENWNGTFTGYYHRKFVDPSVDPQYFKQDVPFRHIRYAEVLLNCAEACIELGEDANARTYINMVRKRAGQPDITESGDALRQRYRHERRIELAYENHRFWDVRRWVIGPTAYHQTHAIQPKYIDASGTATSYRNADGTTHGNCVYTVIDNKAGDARAWDNKAYFFPIYKNELNKNTLLYQNPGY